MYMKRSLYDIFDHFEPNDAMLPTMQEQPIDGKTISDHVMQQAGCCPSLRKKKPYRLFGIAAAAAVLIGGTVTTAAVSGNMDLFFTAVSSSNLTDAAGAVPGVGMEVPEAITQMQPYYSCPDVTFTQTDGAAVSLLGFYNDHNTLMLSVQLTVKNDTILTDDMYLLPYFTLTTEDGMQKALPQGGYLSEPLQPCETSDKIYYATYYLTDEEFSNGTLHVDFAGIYTAAQGAEVYQQICDLQDSWREAYFTEDMSIEEWKTLWREKGYGRLTMETQKKAFAEQTAVLSGSWSADIPIAAPKTTPITAEANGMQVVLDDLSISVSNPSEAQRKNGSSAAVVYLKDGTILAEDFFMFDDVFRNPEDGSYNLDGTPYQEFACMRGTAKSDETEITGRICCYNHPIAPEEIEKVEMYVLYYDDNWNEQIDCYTLYSIN